MPAVHKPLLLSLCLLTAGCAHHPPPPPDPQVAIGHYLSEAYQPAAKQPLQGWTARWTLGDTAVGVTWLAPRTLAGAPVVVYLPGLGQDSDAAEGWRRAWAEAGYAVLSIQPLDYGRAIYSSKEAQAGVFHGLAQRSYSPDALRRRIALVDQALAMARQRDDLRTAGWSQVSVAGFDLGAQTAAALVGERDPGTPPAAAWRAQAAILLSPYVAAQSTPARFAGIASPTLVITGDLDEDPFGAVPSPQSRQQLWRGLAASGSYQLRADGASHALIGGDYASGPPGGEEQDPGKRGRRPPSGGGPGGPGGPGSPGGDVFISHAGHGQNLWERFDPHQAAAIEAVSLAFLDARVRRLPAAQAWLDGAAAGWLPRDAMLQRSP